MIGLYFLIFMVQNSLKSNNVIQVETEVARLEKLKSSKMKELVLKKRTELEEICRKTRLIPEIDNAVEYAVDAIESGNFLLSTKLTAIIFSAKDLFSFFVQVLWTLLVCSNKLNFRLPKSKKKLLAEKRYLKGLRNGWQHAMKSLGLRNTTGLVICNLLQHCQF